MEQTACAVQEAQEVQAGAAPLVSSPCARKWVRLGMDEIGKDRAEGGLQGGRRKGKEGCCGTTKCPGGEQQPATSNRILQ